MTLSDSLWAAWGELLRYAEDPAFRCEEEVKEDIRWLLERMQEIAHYLEHPEQDAKPPRFATRFRAAD